MLNIRFAAGFLHYMQVFAPRVLCTSDMCDTCGHMSMIAFVALDMYGFSCFDAGDVSWKAQVECL